MESGTPSGLDALAQLGRSGGVDRRPILLRVLTDLYVQKLTHTPDEERHYTELALRLLDSVDVAVRTVVAARLAHHLSPPVQVIQRLARDLPSVAEPLRGHPLLTAVNEKIEPPQIPASPKVPVLPDPVADTVELVPEAVETAPSKIERPVTASYRPLGLAADDQQTDRLDEPRPPSDLNAPIGAMMAGELNEAFFAANAEERRLILLNLEIVAPLPPDHVNLAQDPSVAHRLERAALSQNREDFARELAQALAIPRIQAARIAGDELGEPLVTAAKALGVPRDVVYRLLLFVNSAIGHSVERVHALATLYDEITTATAEHMVAIWQALQKPAMAKPERKEERKPARHHPLLWNDEARARARSASATVRRAPAPGQQRSPHRRDAS